MRKLGLLLLLTTAAGALPAAAAAQPTAGIYRGRTADGGNAIVKVTRIGTVHALGWIEISCSGGSTERQRVELGDIRLGRSGFHQADDRILSGTGGEGEDTEVTAHFHGTRLIGRFTYSYYSEPVFSDQHSGCYGSAPFHAKLTKRAR
jgi:hypothetical protein